MLKEGSNTLAQKKPPTEQEIFVLGMSEHVHMSTGSQKQNIQQASFLVRCISLWPGKQDFISDEVLILDGLDRGISLYV